MQIIDGKMSIFLVLLENCVNLGVKRQPRECSNWVKLIVFFPDSSFNALRQPSCWESTLPESWWGGGISTRLLPSCVCRTAIEVHGVRSDML